jgi:hypothetical protein
VTSYPESIYQSVPGHVQQVVLAAILQREANRDYIPEGLATDFTRNAVDWSVELQNSSDSEFGYISISVSLPLFKSPLITRSAIWQRVGTINSNDLASSELARQAAYSSVLGAVAPNPANPDSIPGASYPAGVPDTHERWLGYLLETLLARYLFIKRWNNWAGQLYKFVDPLNALILVLGPDEQLFTGFNSAGLEGALHLLRRIGEISSELVDRPSQNYDLIFQGLIDLADNFRYQWVKDLDNNENYGLSSGTASADISSAASESSFFDPGSEGSTNKQDLDNAPPSSGDGGDGAVGNEAPVNSLKDC